MTPLALRRRRKAGSDHRGAGSHKTRCVEVSVATRVNGGHMVFAHFAAVGSLVSRARTAIQIDVSCARGTTLALCLVSAVTLAGGWTGMLTNSQTNATYTTGTYPTKAQAVAAMKSLDPGDDPASLQQTLQEQ